MRFAHSSLLAILPAALLLIAPASAAETVVLAPFHAVGLEGGGQVVVHAGAVQRVTVIDGSARYTRFTVRDGGLRIENCPAGTHCPMVYKLQVEITVPVLTALAVSGGGSLRADGGFPQQQSLAAAVNQGGIVDMRAVPGRNVSAAVNEGGRVLVTANASLTAAVHSGGSIAYWGEPSSVTKAVHDGGSITRGASGDAHRPASELGPRPPHPVAALPAVAPVPPDADDEGMADGDGDSDENDNDENDNDEDSGQ
jgi:Putative auto-transporter adhesin, head GIN domain